MAEPTRADREAAAKAVGLDTSDSGVRAWVADPRGFGGSATHVAQLLADQRAELLHLAAAVAVKVGEHEFARGVRDERARCADHATWRAALDFECGAQCSDFTCMHGDIVTGAVLDPGLKGWAEAFFARGKP